MSYCWINEEEHVNFEKKQTFVASGLFSPDIWRTMTCIRWMARGAVQWRIVVATCQPNTYYDDVNYDGNAEHYASVVSRWSVLNIVLNVNNAEYAETRATKCVQPTCHCTRTCMPLHTN